jgi:SET domain-containing protein
MDNPKVKLKKKPGMGSALFAVDEIHKGEIIAEFDGDVYDDNSVWTKDKSDHAIWIGEKVWRDSFGFARYINHSCDPNCGVKDLTKIVAMRNISSGEEITWDYEMTENCSTDPKSDYYWSMNCKCGSKDCRGTIGTYKNMPIKTREKYKGYISQWLIDKYGN